MEETNTEQDIPNWIEELLEMKKRLVNDAKDTSTGLQNKSEIQKWENQIEN